MTVRQLWALQGVSCTLLLALILLAKLDERAMRQHYEHRLVELQDAAAQREKELYDFAELAGASMMFRGSRMWRYDDPETDSLWFDEDNMRALIADGRKGQPFSPLDVQFDLSDLELPAHAKPRGGE